MDKIKVGVIGLGTVAQLVHLPNLLKIKYADVKAVCDVKSSRLKSIATKFNISEQYKDYNEMLEKSELDAVIIATPTNLHKQIAIDALNAGKHVLVEKPMARNYNEALSMVEAAKKNKKILMVGMNLRFRPDMLMLKTMINSGEIGDPFYIKSTWIRRQSSGQKWFTKREEAGGGVLLDLGILLLDIGLWLLDFPKVNTVFTKNYYHTTKTLEDTSISHISSKDSKLIHIETSWSLPLASDHFEISIFGTKGSITTYPLHVYKKVNGEVIDFVPNIQESPSQIFKKSYLNEIKSFLGAIRELNPVISSCDEAVERLKIIEAMYKSAKKNQEIKIK